MKGIIDHDGILNIFRKSGYKTLRCPYYFMNLKCGDWCSLFGEPILNDDGFTTQLSLCRKTHNFVEFEDYRR